MANIRLQPRYTPSVSNPFVPQPTMPADTGQTLPRAVEAFGGQVTAFGKVQEAQAAKEDQFNEQKAYIDAATSAPAQLNDLMNNAPPDAPDFAKTADEIFTKNHNDILAKAQASGMQPDQLKSLDLRLSELRQNIQSKAVTYQQGAHESYVKGQAVDAAGKLGAAVFNAPEELQGALDNLKHLVDTLPNIDDTLRKQIYAQESQSLIVLAGRSFAEKDPQGTVEALTPGGKRTYGATPERVKLITETWSGVGLPAQWGFDFAKIESDVGRNQSTSGEDNQGLFQLGPAERKGSKGSDEATNSRLAAELAAANVVKFRNQYGRMPTETEAYLMHQQGTAGGLALAGADPNEPAWKVIAPYYKGHGEDYIKTAIAQGGALPGDATVGQVKAFWAAKLGTTGNPVLDNLTGEQRLAVLNSAQANVNRNQATDRAQLDIDAGNSTKSAYDGTQYSGHDVTLDRFTSAYGPVVGPQKFAEYSDGVQVGTFVQQNAALGPGQVQQNLEALKPKAGSATYEVDSKSYDNAVKAVKTMREQQTTDSASYVMAHFPSVKDAYTALTGDSSADQQAAYYKSLNHAYDVLGLNQSDRKVWDKAGVDAVKERFDALDPKEKVAYLGALQTVTGDLFNNALDQLGKEGHNEEAYTAWRVNVDPSSQGVLADAWRGIKRIKEDSSNALNSSTVDEAFRNYFGPSTIVQIPSEIQNAIKKLAEGYYVQKGGVKWDAGFLGGASTPPEFNEALRIMVGGIPGDLTTGIYNGGSLDKIPMKTIMPPTITSDEWKKFEQNADPDFLATVGNGAPRDSQGRIVTGADIANQGSFIKTTTDGYNIYMNSDGKPLYDEDGKPWLGHLSAGVVRSASELQKQAPDNFVYKPSKQTDEEIQRNVDLYRSTMQTLKLAPDVVKARTAEYEKELKQRTAKMQADGTLIPLGE